MSSEIVHFEIPAKNPAKLSKFYAECFGWKFKDSGMIDMKYWLISAGNKTAKNALAVGGMYKKQSSRQMPINYISTANVENAIKKIKQKGGSVAVDKMEVMGQGWTAIIMDPEGNMLGLFEPARKQAAKKSSKR